MRETLQKKSRCHHSFQAEIPVRKHRNEPIAKLGTPKFLQPMTTADRVGNRANHFENNIISPPDSGEPLRTPVRTPIESALNVDLHDVRVHNNSIAHSVANVLNAKAFTHRHHIWIGKSETPSDIRLIAHETAHVLQQTGITQSTPTLQRLPDNESAPESDVASDSPDQIINVPVLWGLDTNTRNTYLSVTLPGHSIEEIAIYLYGTSEAAGQLRAANAGIEERLRAGITLRPTGEPLTDNAYNALNQALENGTILRTDGIPTLGQTETRGFQFTATGQNFILTETQLNGMLHGLSTYLIRKANYFRGRARDGLDIQREHVKETNSLIRGISNLIAGQDVPPESIWEVPERGAQLIIDALGDTEPNPELISRQARILEIVARGIDEAYNIWHQYIEGTISGAQGAVNALELTRDISFGIAIGIGACVAFPVVAGAAATTFGTGTVASGALAGTAIVTGGGVAGATARGGTNLAGQVLSGLFFSGGPISIGEVWEETKSGFARGSIDAATGLIGAGVGKGLLGLTGRYSGQFATTGQRLVSQSFAYGGAGLAAGGFQGGATGLSEGRSIKEIWQRTQRGALLGLGIGAATPFLAPLAGRLFPYQYGAGARAFRVTPHVKGEIFPGEAQGLGVALRNLFSGIHPGNALRAARELFNPNLRWQRLAEMPDLTMDEFVNPRLGDVILFGPYGGGRVLVLTRGQRQWMTAESLFWNQHLQRGPALGAKTLGWEENVVSNQARQLWGSQGDMSLILRQEIPFITRARHIYFFTTSDMHMRPITWREFEIILDNPAFTAKTTFIPLD